MKKYAKAVIADLFPRHWILTAHGGIEIRQIIQSTSRVPGLYRWQIFSRVRAGGGILPIDTFGQKPLASGWTFGTEGGARLDANLALAKLQGRADG